ncbi:hypothetical protein J7E63_13525 [Bacillus sp. ISL-75]|nr:hypothetical protein [Bacillus sp. ISL-75]
MIHKLIEYNVYPSYLKFIEVVEMEKFANSVASISVTRKGGIPSMPKLEEV